jgi:hypothetical protein
MKMSIPVIYHYLKILLKYSYFMVSLKTLKFLILYSHSGYNEIKSYKELKL